MACYDKRGYYPHDLLWPLPLTYPFAVRQSCAYPVAQILRPREDGCFNPIVRMGPYNCGILSTPFSTSNISYPYLSPSDCMDHAKSVRHIFYESQSTSSDSPFTASNLPLPSTYPCQQHQLPQLLVMLPVLSSLSRQCHHRLHSMTLLQLQLPRFPQPLHLSVHRDLPLRHPPWSHSSLHSRHLSHPHLHGHIQQLQCCPKAMLLQGSPRSLLSTLTDTPTTLTQSQSQHRMKTFQHSFTIHSTYLVLLRLPLPPLPLTQLVAAL